MDRKEKELFAKRLKELRQAKGWVVREVAEKTGIGRSALLNYETGDRSPKSLHLFDLLAKTLDTTRDYLMGFSDHPGSTPNQPEYIAANQGAGNVVKNSDVISKEVAVHFEGLKQRGLKERNIILFHVADNAMADDFVKGDKVLVDCSATKVNEPDIFAIQDAEGSVWFRWIRKDLGGKYTLYANDKAHSSDQEMSEKEFKKLNILGRVTGRWHWRNVA